MNGEPPFSTGSIPVISPDARFTADEVSLPVLSLCSKPVEYPENSIPLSVLSNLISPVVAPPRVKSVITKRLDSRVH